jgi:UDP-N-acetyl-D-glucosamine dehydrogenase
MVDMLRERGAELAYHDPHVPELPQFGLRSVDPSWPCDLAVIVTAHPGVDHGAVVRRTPTVDLRGVTRHVRRAVPMSASKES